MPQKVGGVNANKNNKADFIYENITIQNNLINAAFVSNVKRLVFWDQVAYILQNLNNQLKKNTF